MANVNLYRVSIPVGAHSKVGWIECEGYPGPIQYLQEGLRSIDFQAQNNSPSASSVATISIIGYCNDDCTGCYLIGETTTTSTTIPPVNFTLTPSCEGSGINGTGKIIANGFSGGNGTYTSIAIGSSAGAALSATPIALSGAGTYSFTGVFNGTWYIIIRDSSGASTTKSTTVSCTNTTTTTSTTSTTTNAPICTYNGGSAVITYTSTTTTSTSTTAPTTTTSTSTSTTSTTTQAPTTTTTSTTTEPPTTTTTTTTGGIFTVTNTASDGQIEDVNTTSGAYFYFFNSGAFPITIGQNASGGGATITNGPIYVELSGVTTAKCMTLAVNSIDIETLYVGGSGTYTFSNVTFTSSDVVVIEYGTFSCL